MQRHRRALSRASAALALVLAACSDGGTATPPDLTDGTVAPATAAVDTTAAPTTAEPTTSTAGSATTAGPTTTAGTVPGGLGLSPDGPWTLVDAAPGVEGVGLTYELMPKLWVFLPTEVDLERGYLWTFNEQDRPVIEAYLLAMLTRYRSTDSVPATLDDEGWTLYYTEELAAELIPGYQEISERGEFTDLDLGVVLLPRVIEDQRTDTYVIVLDCELDGAVRRTQDGAYAPGATPGVIPTGYAAGLSLVDGEWIVSGYSGHQAACV